MPRVLFLCSRNRWRSPTAERVFSSRPGVECASAGLAHDAENPVTPEQIEWADLLVVMERKHKAKLHTRFRSQLAGKRVVCLDIPDRFPYMDPSLVELLEARMSRHLPT